MIKIIIIATALAALTALSALNAIADTEIYLLGEVSTEGLTGRAGISRAVARRGNVEARVFGDTGFLLLNRSWNAGIEGRALLTENISLTMAYSPSNGGLSIGISGEFFFIRATNHLGTNEFSGGQIGAKIKF